MYKYNKKIVWNIAMVPFFVSLFFLQYFLVWLLLGSYVVFLGGFLIILSIKGDFQRISGVLKRRVYKATTMMSGIGLILFFSFIWATGYLDIGNYFAKNYEEVKGISSHHISARSLFETFEIEKIKLKSVYIIPEEDFDNEIKAVYLPHSKYVIKLWVYN